MKRTAISILLLMLFLNCNGQQTQNKFDKFISNFKKCLLPVDPNNLILLNEENRQTKNISKIEFDAFLRTEKDNLWKFSNDYIYTYGATFNAYNQFIGLFYARYYMPDDINKQIGEIVLCVFTKEGKMISNKPIGGGYGDNITFNSTIHSQENIEVNFKEYQKNNEKKYTKHYIITKTGLIIEKK